jgi:UDP-N-acetylglucosamine 2-epimerase (non-hydrolysing)
MKKLDKENKINLNKKIEFMKPLGFFDYVKLQMNSYCVISDSGTITEESSILNFPAITIRQSHERPEGMDQGTLIMSGLEKSNVIDSIKVVVEEFDKNKRNFKIAPDYDVDNFSKKVTRIIFSYIDYINRNVWHK